MNELPNLSTKKIIIALIGFPMLYMVNSYMPWSKGIMAGDRDFYISFWFSIIVLHWSSAFCCYYFGLKSGFKLKDFGLSLSKRKIVIALSAYFILAITLVIITTWNSSTDIETSKLDNIVYNFYPLKLSDRILWIIVALTAGVCEEFVYRGFGVTALKTKKMSNWLVVLLTSVSFVFIHGLAAFEMFPFYLIFGIFFGIIRLWRKSIFLNIVIHTLIDLSVMAVVLSQ